MLTDTELLNAWRAGDRRAGSQLFERHFRSVYRFFRSKLDRDVDDLVQQTFLACAETNERYRGDGPFRGYLLGIARKQLLMYLRKRYGKPAHTDPLEFSLADLGTDQGGRLLAREEQRLLVAALRRLPLDLQIALELHYVEGLGIAEMAPVLEIPPGTVKSRLFRGRKLLREAIEAQTEASPKLRASTIDDLAGWASSLRPQLE